MKNSRSEGFLLAKHLKHTPAHKHHHHDGAVFPSSGRAYPTPGHLCGRGWARSSSNGLVLNYKLKEKKNYFYCLSVSVNYNNCSPAVGNDSQNGIHCRRRATIIYELTDNIIMNNSVARCYNDYNYVIFIRLVKQKRRQQRTNVPPSWAIMTAMMMRRCVDERITQCSMSRATLEATVRCHRAIIRPVLPWWRPWSSIFGLKN
jgi:hypothetical protein